MQKLCAFVCDSGLLILVRLVLKPLSLFIDFINSYFLFSSDRCHSLLQTTKIFITTCECSQEHKLLCYHVVSVDFYLMFCTVVRDSSWFDINLNDQVNFQTSV